MDVMKLLQHLISHWSIQSQKSGLKYGAEFACTFPPCTGDETLSTAEYISHLHNQHGYALLECTREHQCSSNCTKFCTDDHHTPDCPLELEGEFKYTADARLENKLLGTPIPPVSLVDYRKNEQIKRWQNKIRAAAPAEATDIDVDISPSCYVHPTPEDQLHRCIVALKLTHPEYADVDLEGKLADKKTTVAQFVKSTRDEIQQCGLAFTVGGWKKVHASVAKWWDEELVRECVAALVYAHPDLVELGMAEKLVAQEMTLQLTMNSSRADLEECGITLTDTRVKEIKEFMRNYLNEHDPS